MNYIVIQVRESIEIVDAFIKDVERTGIVSSSSYGEGDSLEVVEVLKIEGKKE